MARLELHPEVVTLARQDERVLGGGAAGEHGAGLPLVRPGDCEGGGAVWRQGEPGQDEQDPPGVSGGDSPPALSSRLDWTLSLTAVGTLPDTHREVARVVGRLHDADALLGVEGAGVALAHVQTGGPGAVLDTQLLPAASGLETLTVVVLAGQGQHDVWPHCGW